MRKILLLLCYCYAITSYAACPVAGPGTRGTLIKTFAQMSDGKKLYFCQQSFNSPKKILTLLANDLSSSPLQNTNVIPLTNLPVFSAPLGNVDITGGGVPQSLPLDGTPESDFPKPSGQYGKSSIFNFYTYTNTSDNCIQRHQKIKTYLRDNAYRFSAQTLLGVQVAGGVASQNNFAKITGVKLRNSNGKVITGDLFFVHSNPNPPTGGGQYFSDNGTNERMCWFGVKTHLKLDFTIPPEESGTFDVDVRFNQ